MVRTAVELVDNIMDQVDAHPGNEDAKEFARSVVREILTDAFCSNEQLLASTWNKFFQPAE